MNINWYLIIILNFLGFCLFLWYFDVDVYDCKCFIYGCLDDDYYSDEIYECKVLDLIILNYL